MRETDLKTITMLPSAFRMATKSLTSISMEEILEIQEEEEEGNEKFELYFKISKIFKV